MVWDFCWQEILVDSKAKNAFNAGIQEHSQQCDRI